MDRILPIVLIFLYEAAALSVSSASSYTWLGARTDLAKVGEMKAAPRAIPKKTPKVALSGTGPGGGTAPPNSRLTFDDEFNTGSLDPTKWVPFYTYPELINNEDEVYVPGALTFPSGGGLSIMANKLATPYEGQSYSSGAMTTYGTFSQTYGYFEIKAQIPKGQGFWPAFWLLQDNQAWPPEIDVMENIGNAPIYTTYHWITSGTYYADSWGTSGTDYSQGYHTYGVSWLPNSIVFYIDGVPVYSVSGAQVSSQPMYMLLDFAVGGSWPGAPNASTSFPASYNIAWVHAYQYNSAPAVPKTPIVYGPTTLSAQTVLPGGSITAASSLIVGPTALVNPSLTMQLATFWGDANIASSGTTIAVGPCPANTTTPFKIKYAVPGGLAPGTYTVNYWLSDSSTGESEGLALAQRITVPSLQTFSQWEAGYSIVTSATATPLNDGVSNLIKYFCDIDPTRPMSTADWFALPIPGLDTTTTPGTTYLTLSYRQNLRISGVTVNIQTSSDLRTWSNVTTGQLAIDKVIVVNALTGDPEIEVGTKVTGFPKFIRLNVTNP